MQLHSDLYLLTTRPAATQTSRTVLMAAVHSGPKLFNAIMMNNKEILHPHIRTKDGLFSVPKPIAD